MVKIPSTGARHCAAGGRSVSPADDRPCDVPGEIAISTRQDIRPRPAAATRTTPDAPGRGAGYTVRLASSSAEVEAAQRLRYDVFVAELGGGGTSADHAARREADRFDAECDHLLLLDRAADGDGVAPVIGATRLLDGAGAARAGGYYSAGEYDLAPLLATDRRLLEIGRTCLHPAHRGGVAMHILWGGLSGYVAARKVEILFGVASFHGTDVAALAGPLSILHQRHLAPPALRVRARADAFQRMDLIPEDRIDRLAAMRATPALIKAYLRLGGTVGDGAYIDRAFNTVDVCLILDTVTMNANRRALYERRGSAAPDDA